MVSKMIVQVFIISFTINQLHVLSFCESHSIGLWKVN